MQNANGSNGEFKNNLIIVLKEKYKIEHCKCENTLILKA